LSYDLILADPPWPETGGGGRGAQNHYSVVPYDEIPAAVMGAPCWRPARAFWLGLWTTKSSLPHAMRLLEACGAAYVTAWTWGKEGGQGELSLGMGQYGRHGVELILWGRRGQPGRSADGWQRAAADFTAPRGKHSEKPALAYEQALAVFAPTSPLEMFARKERPGWAVWGLEVGSEVVAPAPDLAKGKGPLPTRDAVLAGDFDGIPRTRLASNTDLMRLMLERLTAATGGRGLVLSRERRARLKEYLEAGMTPSEMLKAMEGIGLDPWWMGKERGQDKKPTDARHALKHSAKFINLWEEHHAKRTTALEPTPSWAADF
jgi:N6-adenosine-specific RNA methylase IME4